MTLSSFRPARRRGVRSEHHPHRQPGGVELATELLEVVRAHMQRGVEADESVEGIGELRLLVGRLGGDEGVQDVREAFAQQDQALGGSGHARLRRQHPSVWQRAKRQLGKTDLLGPVPITA